MDNNELLIEIVRAQNRANEILGHIRWLAAAIVVLILVSKWTA
jgi:hypothetical protein